MSVAERVRLVREMIAHAAERVGRSPDEIRILAATKGRSVAEILEALRAGIDLIGENTVQEALSKFEFLPKELEKHMIGTLQPNKAKTAVRLFDMIESVDSFELAEEISRQAHRLGKSYPVLIEVNPTGEAAKRGMAPKEVKPFVERLSGLKHVRVEGLMAMMPYDEPKKLRPYFRRMKELFDGLSERAKVYGWENVKMCWLSMGMSHDFEVAVEEGANLVRLGTCLFGPRRGK